MYIFIYIICYTIKIQGIFFCEYDINRHTLNDRRCFFFECWEHTLKEINLEKDQNV